MNLFAKAVTGLSNLALAHKPAFVIVGTGRCGTGYTAACLTASGYGCAHEGYFTEQGPRRFNPRRSWRAVGDASWLAVPFARDAGLRAIAHQVRHPRKVVESLYKRGFFDDAVKKNSPAHTEFARRHFKFSNDPLESCIRWYMEWNRRCEDLTDFRFRLEDFDQAYPTLVRHLGFATVNPMAEVSRETNARPALVDMTGFDERLRQNRLYPALVDFAARYGYEL